MKGKTLLLLLLFLGVLFGVSQISRNGKSSPTLESSWQAGQRPFDDLDLNETAVLTLSRGNETVTLHKQNDMWTVKNLYDFPAEFSRLTGLLRALPGLKIGDVISSPEPFLEEYGLLDESDPPSTKLSLLNAGGTSLLQLSLGVSRPPSGPYAATGQGQFIQLDDGQVLLMDESLSGVFMDPAEWIQQELIHLPENELASGLLGLGLLNHFPTLLNPVSCIIGLSGLC